ncbi:uncharacterized protein LOC126970810 [Leptidea sinapis]|uniref:uncharacterized protein LOC126970810 n=1 Tax=Leptidea sinapis TaxID=189913 RepID=UPI0021C4B827|nr:uncharacterized protein LOC126970810 [Leptidea sinapis]
MADKLKDYQVLDVLCDGTFYKVKHKVTNNIYMWKAYNCSKYSSEQIQKVVSEVKIVSKNSSGNLLRFHDTILHDPTKVLYFVLEYNSWQNLQELFQVCKKENKYFSECFIWYLLLELARTCKEIENLNFTMLQKSITLCSIFINDNGDIRINCFDLASSKSPGVEQDLMKQVGGIIQTLCTRCEYTDQKMQEYIYSDDLRDVVSFLTEDRTILRPEIVLYHPTVLTNSVTVRTFKNLRDILVPINYANSEVNKCDSEKAVDMYNVIKPMPRTHFIEDSPIYSNIVPRNKAQREITSSNTVSPCMSPTIAALALELPGYVPRSRRPIYSDSLKVYKGPQKVSEETLSNEWMSRLVALRQREESLNQRERDLLAKEIINSPSTNFVSSGHSPIPRDSNGITLPPEISQINGKKEWVSRRRRRRSGSVRSRGRRKSYSYEDLDSSLSADPGDSSIIVTAAKITRDNMPRNLFPDLSSKKVHFTPHNPFAESDESVTLAFYELENIDKDGYQVPRQDLKNITKFKYLNLDKDCFKGEECGSSPKKQAKISKVFSDISNKSNLRKTPSKTSISSKSSIMSKGSSCSEWSVMSKVSEGNFERSRSVRQEQTPLATPGLKKSKRKSLLPFKTPFKFISTSTKV